MQNKNDLLEMYFLDLDGFRYVVDDVLGLWVKFDVKRVTQDGIGVPKIRYALSLHDRQNVRLLGFDNTHAIEFGGKRNVAPKRYQLHWHRDHVDRGRPYHYESIEKLLTDFWCEVEKKVHKLKELIDA